MKIILFLISLLGFSQQVLASCSYSAGGGGVTALFSKPILADSSLPDGSILAVSTRGNVNPKSFSNCDPADVYVARTKPGVVASGIKKINGQTVYETGIPGIGFQVSDIISTVKGGMQPIDIDQPQAAINRYYKSADISKQVTVWLIKTGPINPVKLSSYLTVHYMVGTAAQTATGASTSSEIFRVNIDLTYVSFKETTCEVTPRNGNIVTLQNIDLRDMSTITSGAVGKPKNFTLDINCPTTEINKSYIYWFNPISSTSSTDGVLLNSLLDGASNMGIIIKKDSSAIKFNDTNYRFTTAATQSLTLSADYYKIAKDVNLGVTGDIKVDFEIILQEN